jgi:hypothetical protein
MKKLLPLIILLFGFHSISAQKQLTIFRDSKDSTANVYQLILPAGEIKGMLVLTYLPFSEQLKKMAGDKGMALMSGIPVANYLDIMVEDYPVALLDEMIAEVADRYKVPRDKIIVGGLSAAGTLAIRYAQYAEQGRNKSGIKLAGVMAVDPPLDYERFWRECKKKTELNFNPVSVQEGKMVLSLLEYKYGGSPYQKLQNYHDNSPFSYSAARGGNARWLDNIPVRIYHEPDINWWIENRRLDYYGMNSIDCAALINQLMIDGNKEAVLISTQNKGSREDGSRHPHSWSIVDEAELVRWCVRLFEK